MDEWILSEQWTCIKICSQVYTCMLKKCSNRSQKFSSKSIYSALRHQKGAVAPLNPWMVPLLSVWEVKACFSLVNWHLIQGRKEVTLPCCCEGLTPAFKLLPTVSYSFRQALWNDVSYSCGLKGFAYFYCIVKLAEIFFLIVGLIEQQKAGICCTDITLSYCFCDFIIQSQFILRTRVCF